ncbi:MAG: 30S ribosomal protein S19 [Candidatus Diapherotrites archaeon]|uniref:Small ribosomal subunit protein uS19 n=1 Tax=Candidatus Iainarchaeum sp. TaxID=3101447 RepID=A0A2D6LPC4_9ARCH|nr:30S ribosomal protein S19 [Candidatus Diapherotrites archaeon]|tara:strand:+ start:4593 stop:4994 length:402 start_codon:yes stop_codon:yes gene_type:complete
MVKKEFTFRGKTIEELKGLSIIQFAELCPTRAKRSLLKGIDEHFLKKVVKAQETLAAGKYPKPVKTHNRDNIVVPSMVGITVGVHNGKDFVNVEVKEKMLGHYLGEMVLTRKRLLHGKAGIGATRSSTAITAR